MKLPILLSVPHAGLAIPETLRARCLLTPAQITRDGDEGAREIYALEGEVRHLVTTEIARCVLDMNRSEGDVRKDGVVKTHSCWDEPVWSRQLDPEEISDLVESHHRPYHALLSQLAKQEVVLGIDAHTMAEVGPPVGPDAGRKRPAVCIGSGEGTCPADWRDLLVECFAAEFSGDVTVNDPFSGGWITRFHSREMPWIQLELSRSPKRSPVEKRAGVLAALQGWASQI